jgi:CRISPR-associated exonuclease Cas4
MSFPDEDLLPISALQHLLFCERQCALIHVDGIWQENRLTALGRELHARADEPLVETRKGVKTVRALYLQSQRLGLFGRADVVEFHRHKEEGSADGDCTFDYRVVGQHPTEWVVYPVEYKRGKPKEGRCDDVQLCAQALCLEEMCNATISEGAIFYGEPRRRTVVTFDEELRSITIRAVARLREILNHSNLPAAVFLPHCRSCSLVDECLPAQTSGVKSADSYFTARLHQIGDEAYLPSEFGDE